jgi:hypothetical protein
LTLQKEKKKQKQKPSGIFIGHSLLVLKQNFVSINAFSAFKPHQNLFFFFKNAKVLSAILCFKGGCNLSPGLLFKLWLCVSGRGD